MRKILYFFITVISLYIIPNQANATHIMGGEVTWECNALGQYVFTFNVYRDCSGAFAGAPSNNAYAIHNYPNVGNTTALTLDASQNDNNEIAPRCRPGGGVTYSCGNGNGDPEVVSEYIRVMQPITLTGVPPAAGWIITYDDGNRNANDNIANANSQGITIRAKIFPHSGSKTGQCIDDSPKFREKATSLLCNNSTFTYNHNATDNELDSLVYAWAQPLDNFNGFFNEGVNPTILAFANPYSFTNPFPGPENLNTATGEITLSPNQGGKFVSVVKVTAFKCGERVAEIYRELQSNISNNCSATQTIPTLNAPFQDQNGMFTLFNDTVNAGDLVTFNIQASDFASLAPPYLGDSVTLEATGLQFGTNFTSTTGCNNPPCATLGTPLPQTDVLGVTNTFSWQTDCNHVSFTDRCISGQNTYTFVITVRDDECPIPAINIATISITVVGDTVIESPSLNCVDVQSNGDVDLDWDLTPNINSSFTGWMIYSATALNGPYVLIDSILVYNTTTYTHVGAGADAQQRWYHVRSRSGCKGIVQNIAKDSVSTIFVQAATTPTQVDVNWSALSDPNPTGSAAQYNVFREYPIGTGFNLYQTTAATSLAEVFTNCEDTVTYRVELVNASKSCTSTSNVLGYRYKFPDPQTNFSFPANSCPGTSVSFTNLTSITGGTITYVWDFGDASPTSTLTSPTHTYTSAGTYTVSLTATSGKGCDSILTQQIIISFPNADAGADGAICPGGSLTIGGSPTTTAGNTVVWSPTTGLSSSTAFNPSANPATTTTYTVTVTDPNGCTNTDQVTVTANTVPTADAGANTSTCSGSPIAIGGSPTGPVGATYLWSPTTGLSSSTDANPMASPTVTTTYTVTVTSGVNCTDSDQITVTVDPLPTADAGLDQSICNAQSANIGGSPTGPVGATYLWSPTTGLSSSTASNPTASPTTTTTYTVTVTDGNACTSTDQVLVTVFALPTADAGADQQICGVGSVQIGGSPTGPVGSSYSWSNAASLSNSTVANPTANPTVNTTYTVTITDINGCTDTDQVLVSIEAVPVAEAGMNITVCIGESTVIGGSPTGPVGATYVWAPTTGLASASVANPTATPLVTAVYSVTVTAVNGCTAVDGMTLSVNPVPTADAGLDKIICNGNPVQIGGSPTSTSIGATYLWNNAGSLSSATASNPMASPAVTTTYTVTVTGTNGCTSTDMVLVTVNSNPTADAGADQTICFRESATLGGSPTGTAGSTYLWSPTTNLSSATASNPVADPLVTTTYTVTVTSGANCTAVDAVTITINPLPDADAGPDQTICNGGSIVIGGTPTSNVVGATYAWDNGGSLSSTIVDNPIASPTTTTTYTVTVTHTTGCTETDQVVVTVDALPSADAGADQSICNGGSVQIGGSPTGPAGSTFLWDNGATLTSTTVANPTANPTISTTYSVTVTDLNGCTSVDQVMVGVGTLPTADAGIDQTICETSTVQIGGSPTGIAGTTFLWNNAGTLNDATAANPMATPLSTTTYTVTVTDVSGCSQTDDVVITVDPIPTADAGLDKIICNGNPVLIGGTPTSTTIGVTYLWSPATGLSSTTMDNPTASPSINTTYTVVVTHPNGCTASDMVLVTVNSLPTADAGIDQTICIGSSATIGGSPTGTAGSTYQWDNVATLNNPTDGNPVATPLVTTTYSVTVTSGANCTAVDDVTITVDPLPDADAGLDKSICNGSSTVIGGTPTSNVVGALYAWDNGGSLSNASVDNPIASPTITTTYTVTVTHTNGCTNTDQVLVTVDALPSADAGADQSICNGGTVQIGGSPTGPAGSTYMWDNGATLSSTTVSNPIANPTVTTTYSVTVTDLNGCTDVDQVNVGVGSLPTADAGMDQTICETSTVQIGGSPTGVGTTFLWNNASTLDNATAANPMATPLSTTTYTVTVTDVAGCTQTDDVVVTVNPIPTADAGLDKMICNGGLTFIGGAPTSITPGVSYAWDNGASLSSTTISNPIASPTVTTTYTVTVTIPLTGCTSTDDVLVTVFNLPNADAGIDQTICIGSTTMIGGSPTGPAGSTYTWDNAATLTSTTAANPIANPLATTTYSVTVSDVNGCTQTDQVVITVSPFPNVDAGPNVTICEGSSTPIGGSPTSTTIGATYAWDNAGTLSSTIVENPIANPIVTTVYEVTVTHPNGCTLTDNMTVTVNPAPVTDAGADQDLCIGGSTSIGGSPTGPAGSTYNWDNAATLSSSIVSNPIANPTTTTTYTVTVTDANLCTNTDQVTITINPLPIVDAGGDQIICDGGSATLGGSPTGPVGSTYIWDNAASLNNAADPNPIASPTITTTYTVTVTDVNGCEDIDQIIITVNPVPDVDAGPDQTICNMQSVVIGGTPLTSSVVGAVYAWDNSTSLSSATISNPTANPATTTTYTVTVTHPNGCTATDDVTVTVDQLPVADAGPDIDICIGENTQIGGTPTGPAGSMYSWDNAATLTSAIVANPTANPIVTTTYSVTVTDLNGCTNIDQTTVTVNPLPIADAGADVVICNTDSAQLGVASNPLYSYAWDNVGDLSSSTISNPKAGPSGNTTYKVTVTEVSTGCTATDMVLVTVNPLPVVVFSVSDTCLGTTTQFTNSSTGGANYEWDFGDGVGTSILQDPTYLYSTAGIYPVKLIVTNGITGCKDSLTRSVEIKALPLADAGPDAMICSGDSAQLGATNNPLYTYSWDNAGDLSNSTISNPKAGPTVLTVYTVTVTEISTGCTETDQVTVTVNQLPTADAGADVTICNTDSAQLGVPNNPLYTYAWDNAGDLNSSIISDPKAGPSVTTTYTVTVTETSTGCTATDQVLVTVNPLPVVIFSVSDTCFGAITQFTNTSTGGANYEWNFDDGIGTSTLQNPTYQYASIGIYAVKLIVTNVATGCKDSLTRNVEIKALPLADAGVDVTICNTDSARLGALNNPLYTYAWDNAGDLNSSVISDPKAGPSVTTTYTVTVTETSTGCTETDQVTVTVNPLPVVDFSSTQVCLNETTQFMDLSTIVAPSMVQSWVWDFGDASGTSVLQNPQYTYAAAGTYNVKLIVTSNLGCMDSISKDVVVDTLPLADAGADRVICERDTTVLGKPTVIGETYQWNNFSTLSSATVADPMAFPVTTTTYSVTVTNTNGCTSTDQVIITVSPAPHADAGLDLTICNEDTIVIGGSPTSSTPNSTYLWNNSATLVDATVENPKAFPSDTTEYIVVVTEISTGCTSSDTMVVNVNPLPVADFVIEALCESDFAAFTDISSISVGSIQSYLWDFGDGLGTSTLQNPGYQYSNAGTYDVRLTVTSVLGCINSAVKTVTILPLPLADAGGDRAICFGDTIILGGKPTSGVGSIYSWNPGLDLSSVSDANPKAYPLSTTTYYLSVNGANGCVNYDTAEIVVNALPNVTAETDSLLCAREPVQLQAMGATNYAWSPTSWLDDPLIANPVARAEKNVRYLVSGTDANGCIDTASVFISVFNVDFNPQDTSVCYGDSVQLNPIIQGDIAGITYSWTPSDPSFGIDDPTILNPMVAPLLDRYYTLQITNGDGCVDTDSMLVTVNDTAGVDFNILNSPRCSGAVLEIENTSGNTDSFIWKLNGKFMTRDRDPSFGFGIDNTIENTVTLIGSNANCTDSVTKVIPAASLMTLLQLKDANVFTPNNDGINDIFDPGFQGEFIGCVEFQIYDRWGQKVFDSNIGQYGWDGRTLRGRNAPNGIYYYVITIATEEIKGSVYLSR